MASKPTLPFVDVFVKDPVHPVDPDDPIIATKRDSAGMCWLSIGNLHAKLGKGIPVFGGFRERTEAEIDALRCVWTEIDRDRYEMCKSDELGNGVEEFEEDWGPEEIGWVYCPYCGAPIKVVHMEVKDGE